MKKKNNKTLITIVLLVVLFLFIIHNQKTQSIFSGLIQQSVDINVGGKDLTFLSSYGLGGPTCRSESLCLEKYTSNVFPASNNGTKIFLKGETNLGTGQGVSFSGSKGIVIFKEINLNPSTLKRLSFDYTHKYSTQGKTPQEMGSYQSSNVGLGIKNKDVFINIFENVTGTVQESGSVEIIKIDGGDYVTLNRGIPTGIISVPSDDYNLVMYTTIGQAGYSLTQSVSITSELEISDLKIELSEDNPPDTTFWIFVVIAVGLLGFFIIKKIRK